MVFVSQRDLKNRAISIARQKGGAIDFASWLPTIKKVALTALPAVAGVAANWLFNRKKKAEEEGREPSTLSKVAHVASAVIRDPATIRRKADEYISKAPPEIRAMLTGAADRAQNVYTTRVKERVEPYRERALKYLPPSVASESQSGDGVKKSTKNKIKKLAKGSGLVAY